MPEGLLPLFRRAEERAGERRRLAMKVKIEIPLSPALSPLVPRGERVTRRHDWATMVVRTAARRTMRL